MDEPIGELLRAPSTFSSAEDFSRVSEANDFDASFEGTSERQLLEGLKLTPEQRLAWLERTMAELRKLRGVARDNSLKTSR